MSKLYGKQKGKKTIKQLSYEVEKLSIIVKTLQQESEQLKCKTVDGHKTVRENIPKKQRKTYRTDMSEFP